VITVSNTTPIMSFSSIGKIEILKDIFQEIIIPQAVYDELKSTKGRYGYNEVDLPFIIVKEIKNVEETTNLLTQLDPSPYTQLQSRSKIAYFGACTCLGQKRNSTQ